MIKARAKITPPLKLIKRIALAYDFIDFTNKGRSMNIFGTLLGRYIRSESELNILVYWVVRGVICLIICVEKCRTNGNLALAVFTI